MELAKIKLRSSMREKRREKREKEKEFLRNFLEDHLYRMLEEYSRIKFNNDNNLWKGQ